jgi:hypothetical protein
MPSSSPGGAQANVTVEGSQVDSELRLLFHRLNNQLGIILAHAELLEAKSGDEVNRARAGQVVSSALDAMSTAKAIRQLTQPASV